MFAAWGEFGGQTTNISSKNNISNYYPSAYGKVPHVAAEKGFRRWRFQRLFADACGEGTERFDFLQKMVSEISENENKSVAGALRPRVPPKTRFLKNFYIRRVEKV